MRRSARSRLWVFAVAVAGVAGVAACNSLLGNEDPTWIVPVCPPPATLLITDMETLTAGGPSYVTMPGSEAPSGIRVVGAWCGRSSASSDEDSAECGSESGIEPTTRPEEVHCGTTALKAYARATRRLEVKVDLGATFAEASTYAGIRVWAKGTGPFVPGIRNGGDWYGLADLRPDLWQPYSLFWSELEFPEGTPWSFAGTLHAEGEDGNELSFQVWDRTGSSTEPVFTLLLDDLSFLALP